ncbi:MAG: hypothetical protein RL026_943 [Pseudomonadota bacterium]
MVMRTEWLAAGATACGLLLGAGWLALAPAPMRDSPVSSAALLSEADVPRDLERASPTAVDYRSDALEPADRALVEDPELREESAVLMQALGAEAADDE